MANPSQVSASQVNIEMGVASGTLLKASNNAVKNVAANYVDTVYTNTGSTTTVTIPEGTTHITAYIWGGGGGAFRSGTTRATGGGGAFIYARIPVGAATTFTYYVGAGGVASGVTSVPAGNGLLSRITINGVQYTAGGGSGGSLSAFGAAGTYSYTGGEANIIYVQEGYNGFRIIGGSNSLIGGDAGGTTPVNYGGGFSSSSTIPNSPGAGAGVVGGVPFGGARGEIRVIFESTKLRWSKLRNGINFPGRFLEILGSLFAVYNAPNYQSSSATVLNASSTTFGGSTTSTSTLTINSNGAFYIDVTGGGSVRHQVTWLTYGTNSEYTVNFTLLTGSVTGSQTGSDLALSTTRSWSIESTANGSNLVDEDVATAVAIIKYNGTEILRRRVNLNTGAYYESESPF